jgi:multidrug resistance efflux pump
LSLGLWGNDMSATTRDSVAIRPAPAVSLALKRLLKMMIACGVLAAGVYAVWSAQAFVVSDNAVVSAYVTSLRAPIEGYVSGGRIQVGAEIGQGDILATVTNPRVDDQRLADLQERVQRLALEKAAIMRQHDTLDATWRELMQRAEDYRRAMLARLSGQLESTEKNLGARLSESEQAKREFARKSHLVRSGTASIADLDKAHYAYESLDRQTQSLAGQLTSVKAELEATTHGMTINSGGNDVAYSVQRADEVRLRLADLDRALDTVTGDAAETSSRIKAETRRIGLLRSAAVTAPSAGMLWKVGTSDGERLGTGDTTAEIVDCGAAFLVATIPQSAYADVVLGGEARFRLSGEATERTGTIVSVTSDASLIGDRNLAAVPVDQHKPTAIVRIAVPPSRNIAAECLVGRSARVLLPTVGRSVTDETMRFVRRFL